MTTFNHQPTCSCFLLPQPCPACVRYDAGLKKLRAEASAVREAAKQAEMRRRDAAMANAIRDLAQVGQER